MPLKELPIDKIRVAEYGFMKSKILKEIEDEMAALQEGCPQESCPLSNYDRGKYNALQKLKSYVEGL